ncbi:hypothetical protein CAPTEDRAFT_200931 [Capitella teleta]|uniref:Uncharacterized protein n=1 Tax=Capitella teleta TaxID=283909 RepID=R7U4J2_CAPTE|nr:hypothetical protein CAPTEDRAFT_198771 [Capitella teleta]ELT91746.1 hypothetical protein CAPTEDRAFT_198772 [Capitella teleta]ELT98085.1 hypothetical protein CAPTEDRAFT_200931 [Capitella teleta]|eukprot:ELT91745.1 hypothetical protein CAPTEDRAFT_198771 [Capitella teleta]
MLVLYCRGYSDLQKETTQRNERTEQMEVEPQQSLLFVIKVQHRQAFSDFITRSEYCYYANSPAPKVTSDTTEALKAPASPSGYTKYDVRAVAERFSKNYVNALVCHRTGQVVPHPVMPDKFRKFPRCSKGRLV